MYTRTSQTDPIRVVWMDPCPTLGITFAPGKTGPSLYGSRWDRDLAVDLRRLRSVHGTDVLLSLVEDHELHSLQIPTLVEDATALGIDIRRFPIVDGDVTDDHAGLQRLVQGACEALDAGKKVVVHCRGGHGRAGTVTGCILRARGLSADAAFAALRKRHPTQCPERQAQRAVISRFSAPPSRQDRIAGSLLAAAVGDALGHPTEFMDMATIRRRFGPEGVTGYALYWDRDGARVAPYTDDTQMTECVVRALLETPETLQDLEQAMTDLARRFVDWSTNPQGGHRAPGNACLAGCRALANGAPWHSAGGPKAGGCGSVMRAHPMGLFFADAPEKAKDWAVAQSKLTHRDPIALAASAAMAVGVSHAVRGAKPGAIADAMIMTAEPISPRTARMLTRARTEALDGTAPEVTLDRLRGWAAHEAISAALYIFLRHPDDCRAALLEGTNTPGDSDSLASMAGALVGARVGLAGVPADWVADLERSDELRQLAARVSDAVEAGSRGC